MDNIATIAPYKLDGFKKNMDNVHSLKDPNIRIYQNDIEGIKFQCRRPNQQSRFLNYLFDSMKTLLVWKKYNAI